MKKAILILGAGPEQVDCYKIALKKKLICVGVDKNPDSPGFKFTKNQINLSIYDYKSILNKLKIFKNLKIIGLVAVGVDCPKL